MSTEQHNTEYILPTDDGKSVSGTGTDIDREGPETKLSTGKPKNPAHPRRTRRRGKILKRVLWLLFLFGLVWAAYMITDIFVSPDRNVKQVYLVPRDAVFIIQASEPVADWMRFSSSEPWQSLKQAPSFAEISDAVGNLDSIIHNNKTLLSLVGKRDLIISLHKTRARNWEFLAIVDLQKISKVGALKKQIGNILNLAGTPATERTYNGINITEVRDPDSRETLYMAFVDNHFVISHDPLLVQASIDERAHPAIGLERSFIDAEKLIGTGGLCRVFVNYAYLPQFPGIYLSERNPYVDMFASSMTFAGLSFDTGKDRVEVRGYTLLKEEDIDPYTATFFNSGRSRMKAHEIMSARTALYANVGFTSPGIFVQELEKALKAHRKETYDTYKSAREKLENYFDISLSRNFLDWMSGELAVAQLEPGQLGREPELILAVRARNIKDAKENMELIEKRIKRRSPIKIRNVEYKGYPVNYIEMKGFFRLFFGSLFDNFEKPYYTYIGDYVVFSNQSSSLLSFIEDYRQGNLLKKDKGFVKSLGRAENASTLFTYIDMPRFYPLLRPKLMPETIRDIDSNLDVLYSFPRWMLQVGGGRETSMMFIVEHDKPGKAEEAVATEEVDSDQADSQDEAMDENAETEKELLGELKRFHLEEFEGNVLREFYPSGTLKSEQEIRGGKRHGRFREYYENGAMRIRGKYSNNKAKGTWKYYTPEGKFDRKEKL